MKLKYYTASTGFSEFETDSWEAGQEVKYPYTGKFLNKDKLFKLVEDNYIPTFNSPNIKYLSIPHNMEHLKEFGKFPLYSDGWAFKEKRGNQIVQQKKSNRIYFDENINKKIDLKDSTITYTAQFKIQLILETKVITPEVKEENKPYSPEKIDLSKDILYDGFLYAKRDRNGGFDRYTEWQLNDSGNWYDIYAIYYETNTVWIKENNLELID